MFARDFGVNFDSAQLESTHLLKSIRLALLKMKDWMVGGFADGKKLGRKRIVCWLKKI